MNPRELVIAGWTGRDEAALRLWISKGGIRPAERFSMELEDPVLKRRISHEYAIRVLPVEG